MAQNRYVFQCIPAHEEEARVIIPSLIPIMRQKFGNNVIKNFTPNMVECMKMAIFDPEMGKVASLMDVYITEVEVTDKELNLEKEEVEKKKER